MAFPLSAGIVTSEIDLTTIVPSVSSTEGAFAGVFAWGPTNTPILVSSETDLVQRFGKPITGYNTETFFTAADFLSYGNALYISRAATGNTASVGVVASTSPVMTVQAKYPGGKGNSIKIIVTGSIAYGAATSGIKAITNRGPSTSENIHIAVIDVNGNFAATPGAVLERYENLSIISTAKTSDGTNNYFIDVINSLSNFITIPELLTTPSNFNLLDTADLGLTLAGGTNGSGESTISIASLTNAYDVYKSKDNIDISLILQGRASGNNDVQLGNYIIDNICEIRQDCVAFISPASSDVVGVPGSELANITQFANLVSYSSYAVIDSGYKYRYDKYNDRYIWTPLNGDIAGLCVRTDDLRDPWWSPAGYNRGYIKNVIKLAYNPNKADRDQLYKNNINPVISQPSQGTLLFGDKTHMSINSAFDRINVRRLFIILEKAIARASKTILFEFNDEFTRAQFKNIVEPFLRNVQGRRGITDFRVVCDETNNTPDIVNRQEFVGDIYVKPARSINFVQLNFIATKQGVDFEEIVGKF